MLTVHLPGQQKLVIHTRSALDITAT